MHYAVGNRHCTKGQVRYRYGLLLSKRFLLSSKKANNVDSNMIFGQAQKFFSRTQNNREAT